MKIKFWASLHGYRNRVERVVNVPDEDLEGLCEGERTRVLSEYMRDELDSLVEYGWDEEEVDG